jgi:DNA-binding beta-propeller fold protein YncE
MNTHIRLRNVALSALTTLAITACGGGGGGGNSPNLGPVQGLILAADSGGNLNIFEDRGTTPIAKAKTLSFAGLALSEMHMNKGKALVVISSGRPGIAVPTRDSGGLAVVDLATQSLDQIVTLESTATGKDARLVHAYVDPEGKYFWINNDGPSGDAANDSVFRVNVDPADPGYLTDVTEIVTGNGHHKSAISRPSVDQPTANKLFVTSNLSASSMSVVDDDPTRAATYGTVVKTVRNIGFVPHGMDYSPVSGHVYAGITGGGVVILDTTSDDVMNVPDYDFNAPVADASISKIPASEIPKAGYVHVANNGRTVYTTGYDATAGKGYLSAIDASNNDTVITVVDLGNVASSSFDDNGKKLYVPSAANSTNASEKTNVVEVVDIDPVSPTYHQILREITVGEAGDHRNGEVTPDGKRVVYPDTCDTCKNISVIDTTTDTVIDTLVSEGTEPAAIGTALF